MEFETNMSSDSRIDESNSSNEIFGVFSSNPLSPSSKLIILAKFTRKKIVYEHATVPSSLQSNDLHNKATPKLIYHVIIPALLIKPNGQQEQYLIVFTDYWASLLHPLIFVNDVISLYNVDWHTNHNYEIFEEYYMKALNTEYGYFQPSIAIFSDGSPNKLQQVKLFHNGFPHCPVIINKDTFNTPITSLPVWAQEAYIQAFTYSPPPTQHTVFTKPSNNTSKQSLVYTPLSSLIEDITVNIFAVVWEVVTPYQYRDHFNLTNVLLVDESLTMNPSYYSSSDIVRASLQLKSKQALPILTAGDIICIQKAISKKKKGRFLDLHQTDLTNILIWSGDPSSPTILEAAHISRPKTSYVFDSIPDISRIKALKSWFYQIVFDNQVYTNQYVKSLVNLKYSEPDTSKCFDAIVKLTKLYYVTQDDEQKMVELLLHPTNIKFLTLLVDDYSLSNDEIRIEINSKQVINNFVYGWHPLKENDWLRLRNVKFSTDAYRENVIISNYTANPVITRLPSWCKDVTIKSGDFSIIL